MPTYYVDPLNGSDLADGLSFANAFATTQKATNVVVAGDDVRLCATATEVLTASIVPLGASGTDEEPVRFSAADSLGEISTSGYYTIDANGFDTLTIDSTSPLYWNWYYIQTINGLTTAAIGSSTSIAMHWKFIFCDFQTTKGFYGGNRPVGGFCFVGCLFQQAGADAFGHSTTNSGITGDIQFIGCDINGLIYIKTGNTALFISNKIYGSAGRGVTLPNQFDGANLIFVNNTVYGCVSDGVFLGPGSSTGGFNPVHLIIGNSFVSNGGYGFNFDTALYPNWVVFANNHGHLNTSGDYVTGNQVVLNHVTGDPLFVDAANGDFRIDGNSPLVGMNLLETTIGLRGPKLLTPEEIAAATWTREGRTLTS